MRRAAVVFSSVLLLGTGCLAPFSWPDDRVTAPDVRTGDALTLAAECLDRGDPRAAVPHLRGYLREHPDAILMRAQLAELFFKDGQHTESRIHWERFAADAPRAGNAARDHLPHVHTRLMELAIEDGDEFREQYHRGVGLLCLIRKWDADPSRHDDDASEQTLASALAALNAAKAERPKDARVQLALAEVYERLGQSGPARECRRAARAALPDPGLTTEEQQRLLEMTRE